MKSTETHSVTDRHLSNASGGPPSNLACQPLSLLFSQGWGLNGTDRGDAGPMVKLTPQQVREIAAEYIGPTRTVRACYQTPDRVRSTTRERVARAARTLNLPEPPSPSESSED